MLTYGHGATGSGGQEEQWRQGLSPWKIVIEGDRMAGGGTADNKGQHTINIAALACVLEERGSLGFNSTILIETGEETGSPGLADFCKANKAALKADALIGSDGPRLDHRRPTIFGGTRGTLNFNLKLTMREGGHHSGNWGGLLSNPGIILAHALATITDRRGQIKVPEWRPKTLTNSVRAAPADAHIDAGEGAPTIDPNWGEESLTPVERVFGWNSFEVLAFKTGNPDRPVNAIPPSAIAYCQLRFGGRHRSARDHPGAAPPSRPARLRDDRDRPGARGDHECHAPRPGEPVGQVRRRLDREDGRPEAQHAAQSRRLAAQRGLHRHPGHADGLGAAFLRAPAPSTPPTSTCWPRWPATASGSMTGIFWDLGATRAGARA